MKKILSLLLGILSLCACANDNKQIIQMSQLLAPAQTIVATYAAEETVAVVVMEKDLFETEYEIRFANGNEWKFDQNGTIESLDNSIQALPMELIPSAIVAYVNQHFALSSSIELTFDKSFRLVKTDLD